MPFYEYRCEQCYHSFETYQKIMDSPLKKCPACHEDSLQKLMSASAFHLKGDGWYKTDYKKPSEKPAAKEQSPEKKEDNKKTGAVSSPATPPASTSTSGSATDVKQAKQENK